MAQRAATVHGDNYGVHGARALLLPPEGVRFSNTPRDREATCGKANMSDRQTPNDPLERFRELVTEWERGFDALANRFMGTDEFSRAMNQMQNAQLSMQKSFADAMARSLANVNLPSREDVLRIGEAVHELDMRLARLEQRIDDVAQAAGVASSRPRKGPPRTRKPPSAHGDNPSP